MRGGNNFGGGGGGVAVSKLVSRQSEPTGDLLHYVDNLAIRRL